MYEEWQLSDFQDKYDVEFLIITATQIELETAQKHLNPLEDEVIKIYHGNNTFYCGKYGVFTCAIVKTDNMGSVSSGAALQTTTESIKSLKPKAVIMAGIALGKSKEKQKLGDILVSKSVIIYEPSRQNNDGSIHYRGSKPEADRVLINRFTQDNEHHYCFNSLNKKVNIIPGPLLSGEKLIDSSEFKAKLFEDHPDAIGGEMEAAGVYVACYSEGIPWIIIKSICDWADGEKSKEAQPESAFIVFSYLEKILSSQLAFKALSIHKNQVKKKDLPEINLEAQDILKLLVTKKNYSEAIKKKIIEKNGSKKIYFEYYHFENRGRVEGYLFLGSNITITNTVNHFIEKCERCDILNIYLTKKYNTNGGIINRTKSISSEISKHKKSITDNCEIKYLDDIVWESTIEQSDETNHHKRSDYIDQKLYQYEDSSTSLGQCTEYFSRKISKDNSSSISVIFGSGGIGKTTFCEALRSEFDNNPKKLRKKVFLIKGERTKKLTNINELHIDSLEDLFDAFKGENEFLKIEKDEFKLNYICGNIVVIIDGIDEIHSALGDNFNLSNFFDSLSSLDERFYNTNIILTTRDYFKKSIEHNKLTIDTYKLSGFDKNDIDEFVKIRLENKNEIRIFHDLLEKNTSKIENHSIPMIVNWICEAASRSQKNQTYNEKIMSEYLIDNKNAYDFILYTLLRREIDKQSINQEVDDIIRLFIEIIIENNNKITTENFNEYTEVIFNEKSDNYLKNPLLDIQGNYISVREDALCTLIKSRHLRHLIINHQNSTKAISNLLKEGYEGEGEIFKFISSTIFNTDNKEVFSVATSLISSLSRHERESDSKIEKTSYKKSISALLHLYFRNIETNGSKDKNERTEVIKALFNSSITSEIINGMHIYGKFFALDFTNVSIMNSTFNSFTNFENCTFPEEEKLIFSYCQFENININKNCKLNKKSFESTCKFEKSNILEKVEAFKEDKNLFREKIKENIICLAKYIDSSSKSFNYIKNHTNIKWNTSLKYFIQIMVDKKFLTLNSKGLYKIESEYFDDIPDLKIQKVSQRVEILIDEIAKMHNS